MVVGRFRSVVGFSWVLAGTALLGACGKTDELEPVPEADYVDRVIDSLCTILSRCCERGGYPFEGAACRENILPDARAEVAAYDRTRVRYDDAAAAECIADIEAAFADCTAEEDLEDISACNRVFVGLVPAGGACASGEECASSGGDAYCSEDSDPATGAVAGRCVVEEARVRGRAGDACTSTCEEEEGGNSVACGGVAPGGGGATPVPSFGPADCYRNDGLRCALDAAANAYTCQPSVGLGGACTFTECATGLYCESASLHCAAQITSGSCAVDFDACADGTFCSGAGQCEPARADGAGCESDEECRSGDCVDGVCGAPTLATAENCSELG